MKDLEQRLRDAMDQSVGEGGRFRGLTRERTRRIRFRQSILAVSLSGAVLALLVATVIVVPGIGGLAPVSTDPAIGPLGPSLVYVLDSAPGGDHIHESVTAVQISDGRATDIKSYALGLNADIAVSADGTRLFGVSRIFVTDKDLEDTLTLVDTQTGSRTQLVLPFQFQGTTGFHLRSQIAASPDGADAYVLVGSDSGARGQHQSLATYDANRGEVLPQTASLEGCGAPSIIAELSREVIVVCPSSNDVRFLQISEEGSTANEGTLPLPGSASTTTDANGNVIDASFVSGAVLSADGKLLYVVFRDGRLAVVDVEARTVSLTAKLDLPANRLVGVSQVAISYAGDQLILGLSPGKSSDLRADEILAVDTADWSNVVSVATHPFWALSAASDGPWVFTVDRESGMLEMIDLENQVDVGVAKVGDQTQAILSAP